VRFFLTDLAFGDMYKTIQPDQTWIYIYRKFYIISSKVLNPWRAKNKHFFIF